MIRLSFFAFVRCLLGVFVGLLAACSSAPPAQAPAGRVGEVWRVVWIDGVDAVTAPNPQLRWVAAEQVQGMGGCNAFATRMVMRGATAEIGPLVPTASVCMPAPGGQEDKFFKALETVRKARGAGEQLDLLDANGRVVLMLRQVRQR